MELVLKKEHIIEPLGALQRVTGKGALPILSNIHINAEASGIQLIATDLEVGIRMDVKGEVREFGSITVNAKKFVDIVKNLPNEQSIYVTVLGSQKTEIKCGEGTYRLFGLASDEYPTLPQVKGHEIEFDGGAFQNAIRRTEYAASKDDVRYFLHGVYFHNTDGKTNVVATDTNTLALTELPHQIEMPEGVEGFILPLKAVKEIQDVFKESDKISMAIQDQQAVVEDESCLLTTRLVEGEYPKYQSIIPDENSNRASAYVSKQPLMRAIRRISLLANPKTYAITLTFSNESIQVATKSAEVGEGLEPIAVESSTIQQTIGVDYRTFMEALVHIESETVAISTTADMEAARKAPLVLTPHETDIPHKTLVMPMIINI